MRVILALSLAWVASGCGADDTGNVAALKKPAAVRLDGYLLEGTAAEAKAAGFTTCKVEPDRASCEKPNATILGVEVSLALSLYSPDGQPLDYSTARYSGLGFTLPPAEIDYGCKAWDVDLPYACARNRSAAIVQLDSRLIHQGWVSKSRRSTRTYYRRGSPVVIEVGDETDVEQVGVRVYLGNQEEIDSNYDSVESNRRTRDAQRASIGNFEDRMRD